MSMSTIRSDPTIVRMVTIPGWSATTRPMTAASAPSGRARIAASAASSEPPGTIATHTPSFATWIDGQLMDDYVDGGSSGAWGDQSTGGLHGTGRTCLHGTTRTCLD